MRPSHVLHSTKVQGLPTARTKDGAALLELPINCSPTGFLPVPYADPTPLSPPVVSSSTPNSDRLPFSGTAGLRLAGLDNCKAGVHPYLSSPSSPPRLFHISRSDSWIPHSLSLLYDPRHVGRTLGASFIPIIISTTFFFPGGQGERWPS